MKAKKTWVLVADGARGRILLNEGPGKGLVPVRGHEFAANHAATHEIGVERPGRVHESTGDGTRHAMAPRVDWHDYGKRQFAKSMALKLNEARYADAFDRLVLVLPPKSLGELRAHLDKKTRARVVAELAKDLTQVPALDLPQHLAGVIRL